MEVFRTFAFCHFCASLGFLPRMHEFLMYDVVASLGGFQDFCLLPFLRFACFFATDAQILMYSVVASLGGFQDFCVLSFLRFTWVFATNARIFILCWGRFAWFFLPLMHRFLMYDVVASLGGFQYFCLFCASLGVCHECTNF